jgi:hypothetical protein
MQRPPNRSLEHHRVGRNYNRRKRAARQAEAAEPTEQQPLSHRRLEERAVREGWLQDGPDRARIINRMLGDFEDDETEVRYRVAIGKTLIYADLGQQRLDFQKSRAAAERTAGEIASEALGAEPPKRIIIPDVDDRLEKRED